VSKPPGRPRSTPQPRPTGSIHRDEVLPLAVFRQRTGLGHKGVAHAKKLGLRVIRLGRVGFVLGSDAVAFFEKLAAEQQAEGREGQP